MKTRYPIDKSLHAYLPNILPIYQSRILLKFINTALRIQSRIYRLTRRGELRITDILISDKKRDIPALLFSPGGIGQNAPLLIYYHGGGFAISYATMHIHACEYYAMATQCKILFVDYRLSPKYPWPHGFNDCYRALEWVIQNSSELGVDPQNIVIGGDSAGGALAAAVAQKSRDKNIELNGRLLIYPMLDHRGTTPSALAYKDTPVWNASVNLIAWDLYLPHSHHVNPPDYAVPGLCKKLKGLSSAYIETAEFDPLHDEGIQYAVELKRAGVAVDLHETKGTYHGYEVAGKCPIVVNSLQKRVEFLVRCFKKTFAEESASYF